MGLRQWPELLWSVRRSLGQDVMVRMSFTGGNVVDYFRPVPNVTTNTLCGASAQAVVRGRECMSRKRVGWARCRHADVGGAGQLA